MRTVIVAISKLLALLITSAVSGSGIGFLTGQIVSHAWGRSAQMAFSEGAALFGLAIALFLGPCVFVALGRRLSFWEYAALVASGVSAGAVVALTGNELLVPLVIVLVLAGSTVMVRYLRTRSSSITARS